MKEEEGGKRRRKCAKFSIILTPPPLGKAFIWLNAPRLMLKDWWNSTTGAGYHGMDWREPPGEGDRGGSGGEPVKMILSNRRKY